MTTKLNQVLAIEKSVRTRCKTEETRLHRISGKPDNLLGRNRTYKPVEDGGERLPSESKKAQFHYADLLEDAVSVWTDLLDVTVQKDLANCTAKADVVLEDGTVIIKDVPATFLLSLESKLNDTHKFVSSISELSPNEDWTKDPNSGYHKTFPTETHRTKKEVVPLVLHPGSEHHPAQTDKITKDILVGYWTEVQISGQLPHPVKKEYLRRIEALTRAVKKARESANMAEAPKNPVGGKIFGYLFGPTN